MRPAARVAGRLPAAAEQLVVAVLVDGLDRDARLRVAHGAAVKPKPVSVHLLAQRERREEGHVAAALAREALVRRVPPKEQEAEALGRRCGDAPLGVLAAQTLAAADLHVVGVRVLHRQKVGR